MPPDVFNAKEVADMLGVNERTISRHIEAGKLPASKPGRSYIITLDDLGEYLGDKSRAEAVVKAWARKQAA